MKSGNLVSTFRRGRNSTSPKNPGPRERPAHRWPDWAPPCLTTAGEIEGIPGQDLIIRLFTDQNPKMRDAWDWAIGLVTGGEENPGEIAHMVLLRGILEAISRAEMIDKWGAPSPKQMGGIYRDIAAKARELAAMIEGSIIDIPASCYLPTNYPHEVGISTPELLHNVAADAEHLGSQISDPANHLSPRVSMKLKPKVFVRALVQDLCGAAPPDPAHLATLANAALGLSQPEERVKPHQVIDWLQGFNPAWHPGEALRQKWAP